MEDKEQILSELLSNIAKELNYKDVSIKIEATSSGGANYTSVLYNATITAPDQKELQLFAKVGNLGEKIRQVIPPFMFDVERYVYRDLAQIFKRIEQKAEVPDEHKYIFPKFYGYNPTVYEETIVLENLVAQGYIVYDRMTSIDWPYASKAVETLAKFHALGMAYEEQHPEEYHKLLNRLTEQIEPAYEKMMENFGDFVKMALSVVGEENKERIQKYFDGLTASNTNLFGFALPKRKAVLIHGDFRPSNIMHRVNQDGSVDLIPVDFQTIMSGCGAADLLYFIFSGSDAQFRAKYYQRLVDHYYDSLALALTRLRLDPKKIYPREDFDLDLQETLPFGLVIAVMGLPVMTVESQHAPDLNDGIAESMGNVKLSSYYPERMNGVIDDYVKFGVL